MRYDWLYKALKKEAKELLDSASLEEKFDGILAEVELLKNDILERTERERGELKAEIDALARLVAEKDYQIEVTHLRAARVHELAARLKDEVDV